MSGPLLMSAPTGKIANQSDRAVPLRIETQACWGPLLTAIAEKRDVTRCVVPAFDCRSPEVALAVALSFAFSRAEQDVWLVAPPAARKRIELAARRWLESRGAGKLKGDRIERDGLGSVWLVEPPVPFISGLVVVDAHAVPSSPLDALDGKLLGQTVIISRQLPRGHWAREIEQLTVRLDPALALRDYMDQRGAASKPGAMDVDEVDVARPAFLKFSRTRLKVRSDKPATFLTEAQQAEAARQLGPGWHTGRSGTPTLSFELSRMQRRYLAAKRRAVAVGKPARFLLLKYRRGGFTTLEQALSYYECSTAPNVECATLAHTRDDTTRIFEITQRFHANDPAAPRRVDDGKSKITLDNGSSIFTGTAGGHGFARGATLRRVHGSEVAQWCLGPNQARDVDVLVAGIVGAASNGEVVLESTPNGVEWFCQTYRDAKRGLNDWTPIFLPWFLDPANRAADGTYNADEIMQTLDDEEVQLVSKHKLDVAQLAWRRKEKRRYGRLFLQECPEDDETCFLTSGTCYFSVQALTAIHRQLMPPISTVEHRGFREVRWEQPVKGVEYCVGVDTSEGIPGCDPNGLGILRRDNGAQVASIHGYLSPPALADVCVARSREYNDALLGVERNNHGHAVLQRIADLGYGRPHHLGGSLYCFSTGADLHSSQAGWDTNSETRPRMLADLAEAIETSLELGRTRWVRDPDFVSECFAFRLQNDGKFRADPGAHDDSVMKWAIAWQMRLHRRARPGIATI